MDVMNVTNVTIVIGSQAQKWSCKLTTEFTGFTESSRSSYFPYSILSRDAKRAQNHISAAGATLGPQAPH